MISGVLLGRHALLRGRGRARANEIRRSSGALILSQTQFAVEKFSLFSTDPQTTKPFIKPKQPTKKSASAEVAEALYPGATCRPARTKPPALCAAPQTREMRKARETPPKQRRARSGIGIGIGIGILLRCHLSQYHDISLARENRGSPGRASLANL